MDESLARLQVDYIDCIQVHDPEFAPDYKVRACAHVHHRFESSEAPLGKSFRSRFREKWGSKKRLQQRIHPRSARFVGCKRAMFFFKCVSCCPRRAALSSWTTGGVTFSPFEGVLPY